MSRTNHPRKKLLLINTYKYIGAYEKGSTKRTHNHVSIAAHNRTINRVPVRVTALNAIGCSTVYKQN